VKTQSIFNGLKSIVSLKNTYLYLLMGISAMFGFGILSAFVPTQCQVIGLEAWHISLIMGLGALLYSATSAVIGGITDRYERKKFIIISQAVIVLSAAGLVFSGGSLAGLMAFYSLFCIAEAISFLLSFVYAAKLFNDNSIIGTTMGTFDSIIDISLFTGPLLGVMLYGATGLFAPVYLLSCVPAAAGLFIFSLRLKNEK
jgi:MFS family permease